MWILSRSRSPSFIIATWIIYIFGIFNIANNIFKDAENLIKDDANFFYSLVFKILIGFLVWSFLIVLKKYFVYHFFKILIFTNNINLYIYEMQKPFLETLKKIHFLGIFKTNLFKKCFQCFRLNLSFSKFWIYHLHIS